jgi:hypothetical protein
MLWHSAERRDKVLQDSRTQDGRFSGISTLALAKGEGRVRVIASPE